MYTLPEADFELVLELVKPTSSKSQQGRYQPYSVPKKMKTPRMVPMQIDASGESSQTRKGVNATESSFGQRRRGNSAGGHEPTVLDDEGGTEMSWIPSSEKSGGGHSHSDRRTQGKTGGGKPFTLERGAPIDQEKRDISESDRKGRAKRRTGMRSGSRSVFRHM